MAEAARAAQSHPSSRPHFSQAPLKKQYREQPETGRTLARAEATLDLGRVACRVASWGGETDAGLHPATGGDGKLACSADMLLEALVALPKWGKRTRRAWRITPKVMHDQAELDLPLTLHVTRNSAKSWIFRWKRAGWLRDMGLGSAQAISLAEAREAALACRKCVYAGGDPIEQRKAARQRTWLEAATTMTFRQAAEAYIGAHTAGWRNPKHAAQWPSTLGTYVYPVFGSLPAQAVDVGLLMKALEPSAAKQACERLFQYNQV